MPGGLIFQLGGVFWGFTRRRLHREEYNAIQWCVNRSAANAQCVKMCVQISPHSNAALLCTQPYTPPTPPRPLVMDSDWDTCSLAFQEMNKLLCFWARLPIPESQRLIAAHRAPLRSSKSKNSPLTMTRTRTHTHTHMHACMHRHKRATHLPTHSTGTSTPLCSLPFPSPSCWPRFK